MVGSKVMALKSQQCINLCVIPIFVISRPFWLQFWPMNSRWNEDLIIFKMALVSTHSNDQIKIWVSRARRKLTSGQFGQSCQNLQKAWFDVKLWKVLLCEGFDLVWPTVNLRLTRHNLVILAEKGTSIASTFKRVAQWKEDNIFGFF